MTAHSLLARVGQKSLPDISIGLKFDRILTWFCLVLHIILPRCSRQTYNPQFNMGKYLPGASHPMSLRSRLFAAFILMVLTTGLITGLATSVADYQHEIKEAQDNLQADAATKHTRIQSWLDSLHPGLEAVLRGVNSELYTLDLTEGAANPQAYREAHRQLQDDFELISSSQSELFGEVWLLDPKGHVVLSSNPGREGADESTTDYFREGSAGFYTEPPTYSATLDEPVVMISHPFKDAQGKTRGVLAAQLRIHQLSDIMTETEGLRETGETYLVGKDRLMLTPPRVVVAEPSTVKPKLYVRTEGADDAFNSQGAGVAYYYNYRNVPVVGVYRWVPELQVALLAEESQQELVNYALRMFRFSAVMTLGVLIFAVAAAFLLVRSIIAPLDELTRTATEIEAGNLAVTAKVERADEIGQLAQAFNKMTARLREAISDLEQHVVQLRRVGEERERLLEETVRDVTALRQAETKRDRAEEALRQARDELELRVQERTAELAKAFQSEHQARRIAETLREASLALSETLDLDTIVETLLERLARLVPYDSASILLPQTESRLVVRAARSAAGRGADYITDATRREVPTNPIFQQLLTSHKSILIQDTQVYPNWKNEVGEEGVRSWMGVPLIAGGNIVGLCTLHHAEPGFFTGEHLTLVEALAAQTAVAIQNAWLFDQLSAGRERLQTLSRGLVEVQEAERLYISRELHDEAGQMLTALKVGLRVLEREADAPGAVAFHVARLRQQADDVLENLRRLAMHLRPATLDQLGLTAALRESIQAICDKHDLRVELETVGFDGERLPPAIETALYRIVQETLTNIVRHAHATRVQIILTRCADRVTATVDDDGIGFDPEAAMSSGGLGLIGMQERLQMLGGTLTIETDSGEGTTLVAEVPYGNPDPDRG